VNDMLGSLDLLRDAF